MNSDQWNVMHPVGSRVAAFPITRDEQPLITRTRSAAWTLGGHTPVVMVEGYSGGIALTHVDPIGGDAATPITDAATAVAELGALPMPMGPEPQPLAGPICAEAEARPSRLEAGLPAMQEALFKALDRVTELEAERHTTNESLSDAAEQLRADRDRIAVLEAAAVEARAALAALCFDLDDPGTAALGALYLLQQATVGVQMTAGETLPKVYRASHDSISMGLYLTAAVAREHCEDEERRSWMAGTDLTFDWIEDDGDGVAELVIEDGGEEVTTGYVVTALEISAAYDREADE